MQTILIAFIMFHMTLMMSYEFRCRLYLMLLSILEKIERKIKEIKKDDE
jgi:hypothetical protein